jgi:hypothetical protein
MVSCYIATVILFAKWRRVLFEKCREFVSHREGKFAVTLGVLALAAAAWGSLGTEAGSGESTGPWQFNTSRTAVVVHDGTPVYPSDGEDGWSLEPCSAVNGDTNAVPSRQMPTDGRGVVLEIPVDQLAVANTMRCGGANYYIQTVNLDSNAN